MKRTAYTPLSMPLFMGFLLAFGILLTLTPAKVSGAQPHTQQPSTNPTGTNVASQAANQLAQPVNAQTKVGTGKITDIEKTLWTSAATILGGVIVFVIGQLLAKFLIEPIHDLKKAAGQVRFSLAFCAPTIHTPISRNKERSDKAYDSIMRCSCDLLTKADAIPFYALLPRKAVLPIKDIRGAATDLRALTTYLHETGEEASSHISEINKRVESIEQQLQLRPLE